MASSSTVLGFGMGNYKDATLERLADEGNGTYGYVDTPAEARKMLVEQACGTLFSVAKDVKVQIEMNPEHVAAWRLLGYEDRLLAREAFNDDEKDAGEMGAGHTVTALYEIVPAGLPTSLPGVDPLRYQRAEPTVMERTSASDETLFVKVRYKQPDGDASRSLTFPLVDRGASFEAASDDLRFAASVAAFGMLLRHSPNLGHATWRSVLAEASGALGQDPDGYRRDFLDLVREAASLDHGGVPDPGAD